MHSREETKTRVLGNLAMLWEMTKLKLGLGHFHSGKMHRPVPGIPASGAPTCWWNLKGKGGG